MSRHQANEEEEFNPEIINEDFPIEEKFECWDGTQREFIISCRLFPEYGYQVEAVEKDKDGMGYEFAAHHLTSPYMALGALRKKVKLALSKRFITHKEIDENSYYYLPLHDTLEGRIAFRDFGMAVVIDGIEVSFRDFLQMFEMHEGWQFKLTFAEKDDDFSKK